MHKKEINFIFVFSVPFAAVSDYFCFGIKQPGEHPLIWKKHRNLPYKDISSIRVSTRRSDTKARGQARC